MGNNKSKLSKNTNYTISMNEDRGDNWWQTERGVRYGNSRNARSLGKKKETRSERHKNKQEFLQYND